MQRRQATLKNKHPQLLAHADITCACSLFMQFTVVHVHGSEAKTRKGKEPNAFVTFLRVTAILSKPGDIGMKIICYIFLHLKAFL